MLLLALQEAHGVQPESVAQTFGVSWQHLLAQSISFGIVCLVLYKLAYKPILQILETRRQQIASGMANAEKINAALANIESQRKSVMADAQAHSQQLIAEARDIAKRLQEQEAQRSIVTAEQILAKAREAAEQEHARMLAELRREVGRLVVQTTTAVVGKVLTPDDERRLAEETARELSAH